MEYPEHYTADLLFFFDGKPRELALYQHLETQMELLVPETSVKVQKSQISFYGRHLFAAASLPLRRRKTWAGGVHSGDLRPWVPSGFSPNRRSSRTLSRPLDPPCGRLSGGAGGWRTVGLDPGSLCVFPE